MALDSAAAFQCRLKDLGLDGYSAAFAAKGWDTFGTFGFSTGYMPGSGGDDKLMDGVIRPLLGDQHHPLAAQVRRLFFESYTLAAADMRRRIERVDGDPPKRLPIEEREARRTRLQLRLGSGIKLENELAPSNSLVDLAVQMYEDNIFIYVPWEACSQRSQSW